MRLKVFAESAGVGVTADVAIVFPAGMPDELRADALDRVHFVLRRELQRVSEIALVDQQDRVTDAAEVRRQATLPKDRSHVVVAAGTKDPASVTVLRGVVTVLGTPMAAKREQP